MRFFFFGFSPSARPDSTCALPRGGRLLCLRGWAGELRRHVPELLNKILTQLPCASETYLQLVENERSSKDLFWKLEPYQGIWRYMARYGASVWFKETRETNGAVNFCICFPLFLAGRSSRGQAVDNPCTTSWTNLSKTWTNLSRAWTGGGRASAIAGEEGL